MAIIDTRVLRALGRRTFMHSVESPIAYVVAIFFYAFIGAIFGANYFSNNQASASDITELAPWILWFVIPTLTMSLISEEIRSGTFEQLATLPVRDWEIVLGKFFGFALLAAVIIGGLVFFPIIAMLTAQGGTGVEWGPSIGMLAGLYLMCLSFGAIGLFASSLTRNQVVALIVGMIFCTFFFFVGHFYSWFPGPLSQVADFVGVLSHLRTLSKGVWDIRDLAYFASLTLFFLFLTVQRLTARRF